MTKMIGVAVGLCSLAISCAEIQPGSEKQQLPNILFIVADDLGYADLGCYGGVIETPNLDRLAAMGTMFTNFHTSPKCAPTRAMFLTGNDNHIAGMGIQGVHREEWGYEGYLTDRVVTIPQVLQSVGYHTYIAGKWHLGDAPEHNPAQKGFERSFVLLEGAGNHSDNISVLGVGDTLQYSTYTEDGEPTQWLEGAYSTEFYTDKIIGYIDENIADQRPFFALATYTSPHWPLQVDSSYWRKYEGWFDMGYEAWRQGNMDRLINQGILPEGTELPPLNPKVARWDSLTTEQRRIEARKMELYAGMVDHLDGQVGRLITYLKSIDALDNTQIVFMSDNGAANEDFFYKGPFVQHSQKYFNNEYENMGNPDSYVSYGPQWAEAGTAAFRDHKSYTREGGILAPLIISGRGVVEGVSTSAFATLLDIAPTIYDWAEAEYPSVFNQKEVYPLRGRQLVDFLATSTGNVHDSTYVFVVEHSGNMLIRKGDWKLFNRGYPIEEDNFELYNLAMDITESNDLSSAFPDKRSEMLELWRAYQKKSRVLSERP
ncbi:MAG: arylsulfatase [Cyclobacteriaceae bacterium]